MNERETPKNLKWKRLMRVRQGNQRQSTFVMGVGDSTVVRHLTETLVSTNEGLGEIGEVWEVSFETMATVNANIGQVLRDYEGP